MPSSLRVGEGSVTLNDEAAPLRFHHPDAPAHPYLLQESSENWHTAENRWGAGFLISDRGAARWQHPAVVTGEPGRVVTRHEPLPGLTLEVTRTGGETLTETYRLTNTLDTELRISGLAVQTPFRDIYPSSAESLAGACHAHVWTGGSWAWALAQPMSGSGPLLGLVLRTGALWSYSVESRNHGLGSNNRGHLLLHATDLARNPDAFGGQPTITVPAQGRYEIAWEIGFHATVENFLATTKPPVRLPRLAVPLGETLTIAGTVTSIQAQAVPAADGGTRVSGRRHGVAHLEIGENARTAVLFHLPRREIVERRVAAILAHHRPVERAEPYRHAFVPLDTGTGLRQLTSGWADWSDGAERLGMPLLLQRARLRDWGPGPEIDAALAGFADFARAQLIDADGTVRWGSDTTATRPRLYNVPWLAQFFADQHLLYGDPADLDLAARLLERGDELGAGEHLSIGGPEAVLHVGDLLSARGERDRADRLAANLTEAARHFAALGPGLPGHEVNYEQSMVAPLVSLYALAYQVSGEEALLGPLAEALRWLRAFGGPQPHVRLRDIGVRHWDGYWFGRNRQYGDVFPHHWSALTAVALTQLPPSLRTTESDAAAERIFTANLALFREDGSATCAFVMPSCVDGVPGYREDPLANDQDWALVLWLRAVP